MKKIAAVFALGALSVLPEATAARAEDCLVRSGNTDIPALYNQCVAANLARQRTLYVPQAIQNALEASFGIGPDQVEEASLNAIVAGEAEQHLSPSDIRIVATADQTAAQAVASHWNLWVDGRYLYSDYAPSADDSHGPTWSGLAGLDYKISPKFSAGLLLSADSTDLNGVLSDYNSSSAGLGAYIGYTVTDHIVFSANLLRSWVDSKQVTGLGTLNYDTDRYQASAAVNGYWYSGAWRINPALTLAWSKDEEEENHALTPDRTIETGVLTPSLQIGRTFRLSDKVTAEPWAGAYLDWTFLSDTHTAGAGTVSDPNTDLRLQAGLNFGFGSNAQLALTAEAAGLLLDTVDSYAVEANLAIQF